MSDKYLTPYPTKDSRPSRSHALPGGYGAPFATERPAAATRDPDPIVGLGGWLLGVAACLAVVEPLLTLANTALWMFELGGHVAHATERPEGLRSLRRGVWALTFLAAILCACAGIVLILLREGPVVPLAIGLMWAGGPIAKGGLLVLEQAFLGHAVSAQFGIAVVSSVTVVTVFTAYLLRSRRVARTYCF